MPPVRLLLGALAVSFAGFALFWLDRRGWLAVVGLLVSGLGNSLHYPLAISLALEPRRPGSRPRGRLSSYAIAVGFGVAPFALGWLADQVGAAPGVPDPARLLLAAAALTVWLGRATRAAATVVAVPVSAAGRA